MASTRVEDLHAAANLGHVVPAGHEGALYLLGDLHGELGLLLSEVGLLEERVLDLTLVALAGEVTLLLLEVGVAQVLAALAGELLVLSADLSTSSANRPTGKKTSLVTNVKKGREGWR